MAQLSHRGLEVAEPRIQGKRNRWAALTLVVIAPFVAELALGSTPIHLAYLILLWLPIYGAGVLLIREAVVRTGGLRPGSWS